VLVAAALGSAAWWLLSQPPKIAYATVAASQGSITRAIAATGTVNPQLTVIVGSSVSGIIQSIFCDYNTEVHKGQVCAKIDPRPYRAAVEQARANLSVAQAQRTKDQAALDYAELAFNRASHLARAEAVSLDALDNARSVRDQARAQVSFDNATIAQRTAALDAAQANLDYTDIVSPVDGTVVSRAVTQGQTVTASFQTPTLFLIATDLAKMQVDANVSESDIGEIAVGKTASFTVDAFPGRVFGAEVGQVRQSPQTVQNVVTYDVVISVTNADLALKPGMTAETRIVADQRRDALRVPNAALRYHPAGTPATPPGRPQVWRLRDGKPEAVAVTTGLQDDAFTEITGGSLRLGDHVITAEHSGAASRGARPAMPL
jgi:HlyD family secretion protein